MSVLLTEILNHSAKSPMLFSDKAGNEGNAGCLRFSRACIRRPDLQQSGAQFAGLSQLCLAGLASARFGLRPLLLPGPAGRMSEWQPRTAFLGTGHALPDEVHAVHTVVHVWIQGVFGVNLLTCRSFDNVVVSGRVDVGEGFDECFRMPRRKTAAAFGRFGGKRGIEIARVKPMGLPVHLKPHFVGLFLVPFERTFSAINFDPQIVFAAVGNL
jgi:hypothetical protein